MVSSQLGIMKSKAATISWETPATPISLQGGLAVGAGGAVYNEGTCTRTTSRSAKTSHDGFRIFDSNSRGHAFGGGGGDMQAQVVVTYHTRQQRTL